MLIDRELLTRLEALQIPSRRRMRQQHRGEKTSLRKGSSLEFSDYREYLQGDDIRRIDWNVYARTERLYLKLFFEEESRPVLLLIDGSESMGFGSPAKFARPHSCRLSRQPAPRPLESAPRGPFLFAFAQVCGDC